MKRFVFLVVAALAVVAARTTVTQAAGDRHTGPAKQPVVTGYYRGQAIHYYDFGPIKLKPGNKLAPIWAVTNGVAAQHNIVDTVPGKADYSPLWRVEMVTWKDGVTPRLLTSTAQVTQAQQAGEATVTATSTVVNCPVLGFGQQVVTGFSNGHRIHYYDLGVVKVKPGNTVEPLYAPTNGVKGQHNISLNAIARGQTAYPALWGILAVSWKAGAHKTLLTSAAQVRRLKAAGQLTIAKTNLVVNCSLVA